MKVGIIHQIFFPITKIDKNPSLEIERKGYIGHIQIFQIKPDFIR